MFIDSQSSFQMKIWLLGLTNLLCHKSPDYGWENEMANKYWKGQKPEQLKHIYHLPLDSHCQQFRVTVTALLLLMFSTKMELQFSYVAAIVLREFSSRSGTPSIFGFFSFVTVYFLKSTMTWQKHDYVLLSSPGIFFLGNRNTYKVFNWTNQMLAYDKNTAGTQARKCAQ